MSITQCPLQSSRLINLNTYDYSYYSKFTIGFMRIVTLEGSYESQRFLSSVVFKCSLSSQGDCSSRIVIRRQF